MVSPFQNAPSGRSDAADRLIAASEPLASLQHACGGEIPGEIAVPALRELVGKARKFGLKLARAIKATDGRDTISAWIEVAPDSDGAFACRPIAFPIALETLQFGSGG